MPAAPGLPPEQITGLILAGGQGLRMGGADKGLLAFRGRPLVAHVIAALTPQVGSIMLSANRNLADYQSLGYPVWPDQQAGHPGPMAGLLAGLAHCQTPYLALVPCDCPRLPADLIARLAQALVEQDASVAMAGTPAEAPFAGPSANHPMLQPMFCLLASHLQASLVASFAAGQRSLQRWARQQRLAIALYPERSSFANTNTLTELQALAAD